MGQHAASPLRPPPGARVLVFRGDDPCAVARAVREAVGDGFCIPAGPFRYPYAAIVHLLRDAGLFVDPSADTATDPVISREALTDLLRKLLPRGIRIGLCDARGIDHASAGMLRAFAETAQLAAANAFVSSGLVIGAAGAVPDVLQLPTADICDMSAAGFPPTRPSAGAQRVLALVAGAPHPVLEESLAAVCGLSAGTLRSALQELAASELVEIGSRIALGPACPTIAPTREPWLETSEVRLPRARLAVQADAALARHLAREAWQRGEAEVVVHCLSLAGLDSASPEDELLLGRALVAAGSARAARPLFDQHAETADELQAALLAADLAMHGELAMEHAEKLLRRPERGPSAPRARVARARLLLRQGNADAARNLLRRSTKAELEACAPDVRLEHELAVISATPAGVEKRLRAAADLCVTRAQRRRLAAVAGGHDPAAEEYEARLAAEDLDATALRHARQQPRLAALKQIMQSDFRPDSSKPTTPASLFSRLRERGATVMAALVGESLEIHPPGARTRPGLAAQLEEKLRRLRAHPHAVSFGRDEFAGFGPFAGGSALALRELGEAGPLIVVFRGDTLPAIEHLLGDA